MRTSTFGTGRSLNELAQYFQDQLMDTREGPERRRILRHAPTIALCAVSILRPEERNVNERQWEAAVKTIRHACKTMEHIRHPEDAVPFTYVAGLELQDIVHTQFDAPLSAVT